jgi:uncharacterized membrane protein YoaK (UPF0700 family)
MFRREGPSDDPRKSAMLAGYLAFVAGFVNSGGFVLIDSFTSHVTGTVGRLANDVAHGDVPATASAASLVLIFFLGAFAASLIIEGSVEGRIATAYGVALLCQSAALAIFVAVAGLSPTEHPRVRDAEAAILCFALGMQNSLVTRLSGAVIRTTHLTGVVTDLGIEAARWYRWYSAKLQVVPQFLREREPAARPAPWRSALLGVIVVAFIVGAILGATLTEHASRWAMALPAVAILLASIFAFSQRGALHSMRPPPR